MGAVTDATVVIPVFNQAHYTRMCLDSLRDAGLADSRILVIDNASTDQTAEYLATRPDLRIIRNSVNRFCGAWNQGAKAAAPAEWTVILNNDVLVPKGWLEGLAGFAQEEGFDVASPAMCEGEMDYDFAAHAETFMRKMSGVKRCGIAHGVCFMVRRRVFDTIGFFDDDPRLGGFEDDEFFRRCRKNGFRLATTGRSFLHHFGSITQKAVKAEMNRPRASLGDRDYYRQKLGLTWFTRRRERWLNHFFSLKWRLRERVRHGLTLRARREAGGFVWQ